MSGAFGVEASNADVGEVVIYNKVINEAERIVVQNHLSAKYGVGIAGQDRYAGDDPGNGDYDSDVIGIGRVNASNQLTAAGNAGLGIEATGGSLGDGAFVMAGHKVAINSITNTGAFNVSNRTFFIDSTGNVDVDLVFDYSDLGLEPPGAGSTIHLLSDPLGGPVGFTSIATGVLVGDQVTFSLSNIGDGLFTVAQEVPEPSTIAIWPLLAAVGIGLVIAKRRGAPRR
jgi:hypothetical protein